MKTKNLLLITLTVLLSMCTTKTNNNPLLQAWNTPHATAPFDKIKLEHYLPAMKECMEKEDKVIEQIIQNTKPATFENTIEALENGSKRLERITSIFGNLMSAETSDEMQDLAKQIMPILTRHSNQIMLNEALFQRIKKVYDQRNSLSLNKEQTKLLEDTYQGFARNGANLNEEQKTTYKKISEQLSQLTMEYGECNLKATNQFELLISNKEELKGLPESALEAAEIAAQKKEKKGWLFTLHYPSYVPVMTYASNRKLRHDMYLAYTTQCSHNDKLDTKEIVKKIANLRLQMANLLGYRTYADYILINRMAEKSQHVYQLLDHLIEAYRPAALKEKTAIELFAKNKEGHAIDLKPWDWGYYSNLLKDKEFSINQEMLRPYFELSQVKKGVFGLATKLYGITFKENKEIPVYHKDVDAYEVMDKDGKYLGVLYTDFFPRAGKRSGAWMTEFKGQWIEKDGTNSRPHISLVMNFTMPTKEKPALLTYNEVETFLHEFGHSLHGMLSNVTYNSLSGTNVYRDFVELPSQFMENFGTEKEFLHTFAKHYKTGEIIPDELIQRLIDSSNFNAGNLCLRQVTFALLDMAWHDRATAFEGDVISYEHKAMKKAEIMDRPNEALMSTHFGHIFSGGYAAGYYGYKWAEVLDADAFAYFKKKGIFNASVANSFRENILSKGGTQHPMKLYKNFKGSEPTIDALLERNGLKTN